MRRFWHLVWLGPLVLFGFLWMRAGWDLRYLVRVLVHRDSSTSDLHWKDAVIVAPVAPVPWREAPDCDRVRAAFAPDDLDHYLLDGGALGFVVIRHGALVCEWYGNGGSKDSPAMAFSISKTVTSLLLARAIANHTVASLDDPITRYLPELAARDPRFEAITLAELVDMRSGIAFAEDTTFPWVDSDSPAIYYASDLAGTVLAKPRIATVPGPFLYNDYAPNLIGLALERASGLRVTGAPTRDLVADLGTANPVGWLVDRRGFAWHESGLVITARDLARVGELVLDGGKAAPAAWIARSRTTAPPAITFDGTTVGYRNGWWQLGDDLVAMGRYGQIMVVAPATGTVIVRLGLDGHAETNISIARRLARIAAHL